MAIQITGIFKTKAEADAFLQKLKDAYYGKHLVKNIILGPVINNVVADPYDSVKVEDISQTTEEHGVALIVDDNVVDDVRKLIEECGGHLTQL